MTIFALILVLYGVQKDGWEIGLFGRDLLEADHIEICTTTSMWNPRKLSELSFLALVKISKRNEFCVKQI